MSQENVEIVARAMEALNASAVLAGEGDPVPWLHAGSTSVRIARLPWTPWGWRSRTSCATSR
jgi:hypothetical protein